MRWGVRAGIFVQVLAKLHHDVFNDLFLGLRSRIGPVGSVPRYVSPNPILLSAYARKFQGARLGQQVVAQARVRDPELERRDEQLEGGVAERAKRG